MSRALQINLYDQNEMTNSRLRTLTHNWPKSIGSDLLLLLMRSSSKFTRAASKVTPFSRICCHICKSQQKETRLILSTDFFSSRPQPDSLSVHIWTKRKEVNFPERQKKNNITKDADNNRINIKCQRTEIVDFVDTFILYRIRFIQIERYVRVRACVCVSHCHFADSIRKP